MKCISGINIVFSDTISVCVKRGKDWRACVISGSSNLEWGRWSGMSAEIIPLICSCRVIESGGPSGRSALCTPQRSGPFSSASATSEVLRCEGLRTATKQTGSEGLHGGQTAGITHPESPSLPAPNPPPAPPSLSDL